MVKKILLLDPTFVSDLDAELTDSNVCSRCTGSMRFRTEVKEPIRKMVAAGGPAVGFVVTVLGKELGS